MVEDKSDTEIAVQVQVQAHVESRTGTTTEVLSQARVDEGVDMTEEREEKGM